MAQRRLPGWLWSRSPGHSRTAAPLCGPTRHLLKGLHQRLLPWGPWPCTRGQTSHATAGEGALGTSARARRRGLCEPRTPSVSAVPSPGWALGPGELLSRPVTEEGTGLLQARPLPEPGLGPPAAPSFRAGGPRLLGRASVARGGCPLPPSTSEPSAGPGAQRALPGALRKGQARAPSLQLAAPPQPPVCPGEGQPLPAAGPGPATGAGFWLPSEGANSPHLFPCRRWKVTAECPASASWPSAGQHGRATLHSPPRAHCELTPARASARRARRASPLMPRGTEPWGLSCVHFAEQKAKPRSVARLAPGHRLPHAGDEAGALRPWSQPSQAGQDRRKPPPPSPVAIHVAGRSGGPRGPAASAQDDTATGTHSTNTRALKAWRDTCRHMQSTQTHSTQACTREHGMHTTQLHARTGTRRFTYTHVHIQTRARGDMRHV